MPRILNRFAQGVIWGSPGAFTSMTPERGLVKYFPARCAAECAVRFEPMRANMGFFATSTKCFRAG